MKKWLSRALWIPTMIAAVLFLVANRQPVAVSLDPFSTEAPALATPALPLWFWLMSMMFLGLGAGAVGTWLSARPGRVKAREARRAVKALRRELSETKARLTAAEDEAAGAAKPPLLESVEE